MLGIPLALKRWVLIFAMSSLYGGTGAVTFNCAFAIDGSPLRFQKVTNKDYRCFSHPASSYAHEPIRRPAPISCSTTEAMRNESIKQEYLWRLAGIGSAAAPIGRPHRSRRFQIPSASATLCGRAKPLQPVCASGRMRWTNAV